MCQAVSGRVQNDLHPQGEGSRWKHRHHSVPQSGSGPIQHTYMESWAVCWVPGIQDGKNKMLPSRNSWWALTRFHFLEKGISFWRTRPQVTYNRQGHTKNRCVSALALRLSTVGCPGPQHHLLSSHHSLLCSMCSCARHSTRHLVNNNTCKLTIMIYNRLVTLSFRDEENETLWHSGL